VTYGKAVCILLVCVVACRWCLAGLLLVLVLVRSGVSVGGVISVSITEKSYSSLIDRV